MVMVFVGAEPAGSFSILSCWHVQNFTLEASGSSRSYNFEITEFLMEMI